MAMKTPKGLDLSSLERSGAKILATVLPGLGGEAARSPVSGRVGRRKPRGAGLAAPALPAARLGPLLSLDCSSTATGWAIFDGGRLVAFGLARPRTTLGPEARIDATVVAVAEVASAYGVGRAVMEWSSGKKHGRIGRETSGLTALGAAQGAIRQRLIDLGIRPESVRENVWTGSRPKAKRAEGVRLLYPLYAAWANLGEDEGLDVADAIGLGHFFMGRVAIDQLTELPQ